MNEYEISIRQENFTVLYNKLCCILNYLTV